MKEHPRIELDRGPWPDEAYRTAWPIGGRIAGHVRLETAYAIKARGVRVELAWHTEGRGDGDLGTVAVQTLHTGNVEANMPNYWPFELAVPDDGPITYDGQHIQIRWEIRAVVDVPMGRDLREQQPITILPDYDPR